MTGSARARAEAARLRAEQIRRSCQSGNFAYAALADADFLDEIAAELDARTAALEDAREALWACIPWVATSHRGAAQEALALACEQVGSNPYDWTAAPDVLTKRRELLGLPDRRLDGGREHHEKEG